MTSPVLSLLEQRYEKGEGPKLKGGCGGAGEEKERTEWMERRGEKQQQGEPTNGFRMA